MKNVLMMFSMELPASSSAALVLSSAVLTWPATSGGAGAPVTVSLPPHPETRTRLPTVTLSENFGCSLGTSG